MSSVIRLLNLSSPPSLHQAGPALVEITDDFGRVPSMTANYIHIRSGDTLKFKICPQVTDDNATKINVAVECSKHIKMIAKLCEISEGRSVVYVCQLTAALPQLRFPLPKSSFVYITVTQHGFAPATMKLSVAIWPSRIAVMGLGISMVSLPILGHRFLDLIHTHEPFAALVALFSNSSLLLQSVFLGIVATLLVHFFGWLQVWTQLTSTDSQ